MKKLFVLVSTLLLAVSATVFATDDTQTEEYETIESGVLPEAPQEVVSEALESCRSWAKEDNIGEEDMESYLLNCVNDVLNEQGYLPVSSIAK